MSSTNRFLSVVCVVSSLALSAADAQAQVASQLVPLASARQAQLETVWSTALRVDPARGRVQSIRFHSNLVFAQTSSGIVQAIDGETGRTYWTTEVGSPNMETTPPSINDKYVAVTNGSNLYVLSRATGSILYVQRVGGAPSAGTAVSETDVIVPLATGILEAYKLKRERVLDQIPQRFTGNGSPSVAPIVVGNRTIWSTPQGFVFSREISKTIAQFRFRLDDNVDAPPAYMGPYVYAASRSGRVYAIQEEKGTEVWQFPTENTISEPIVTIDGRLLVVTEKAEMFRLDPRVGSQMWYTPDVARFLAVSVNRIYALDSQGRIVVLDANTGSKLTAVPTSGRFDVETFNTQTDRVYLCDSSGLLQCLRERRETDQHPEWAKPIYHTRGYAIPPVKKAVPGAPAEGTPAADGTAPADGTTPAAPAGGANPFGT